MTERARSLPPGVLIAGSYRIERRLGEGTVGPVVMARDTRTSEAVAVKFLRLRPEVSDAPAWFLREAQAAARIDSEFVARVSDSGTLDGLPYLVMEYLEGQTLQALLEKRRRLPVALLLSYALQAVEGLAEAHALGVVHRDLRPSNLFLARRPDGSTRLKLLDFGIAKSVYGPGDSFEQGGDLESRFGSPRWMAPEQIRASSDTDRRSDLWSMGAILYEALAGAPPFGAGPSAEVCARVLNDEPAPLRAIRPDVPETLDAAIMQCLEKDPLRRFRTAGALARAVAACATAGGRKSAERIARISRPAPAEIEGVLEESTPAASTVAVVPRALLTQTGFGRALEGIERIVQGEIVDAVEPAPRAPPVVSSPVIIIGPPPPPFHSLETPGSFALPKPARRSVPVMLVIAGAAMAVVVALFLVSRTGGDAPPAAATTEATAGSAASAPEAPSTNAATRDGPTPVAPPPVAVPSPPPAVVAGPAPVATPAPITPTAPAAHARRRVKAAPQTGAASAQPSPPATAAAAPIGTAGFGGRD